MSSKFQKWLGQSPPVEWATNQLRDVLIGAIRQGRVPQHVAFVMDGNRRFARSQQMEIVEGHNMGFEALTRILEVCYRSGVRVVTAYAFSIENFKRSKYEVDALMEMAKAKISQIVQHGDLLERYGARIQFLGQRSLLRPDVLEILDQAVEMSKHNGDAILNICFPYTSRNEMTTAIRETVVEFTTPTSTQTRPFSQTRISQKIRSRTAAAASPDGGATSPALSTSDLDESLSSSTTLHPESPADLFLEAKYPDPESITVETLDAHMFTAGCPPLDLLIRTSGVNRLSDFLLWQCHQNTHIAFLDCFWPEFDLWHFLPVLVEWQWRHKHVEMLHRTVSR